MEQNPLAKRIFDFVWVMEKLGHVVALFLGLHYGIFAAGLWMWTDLALGYVVWPLMAIYATKSESNIAR